MIKDRHSFNPYKREAWCRPRFIKCNCMQACRQPPSSRVASLVTQLYMACNQHSLGCWVGMYFLGLFKVLGHKWAPAMPSFVHSYLVWPTFHFYAECSQLSDVQLHKGLPAGPDCEKNGTSSRKLRKGLAFSSNQDKFWPRWLDVKVERLRSMQSHCHAFLRVHYLNEVG